MPYKVFNADEAAAYLHVPREALDRLVKNKEIPFQVQGGRTVFTRYDIDAWASQRILRLSGESLDQYHRESGRARREAGQAALMPELVRAEWIEPALAGRTAGAVLREMVKVADRSERVCDPRQLQVLLEEREALCSTGLPGGLAILHPRQHTPYMFSESFMAVGRTVSAVPFGAPDGELTDLFFLLGCGDDGVHLHTLARLCAMCQKTGLLKGLRQAETAEEMAGALLASEQELLKKV